MTDAISYQDYIPTDRWSLQDWYLMKMVKLERLYTQLMQGWYGGGVDRRALVQLLAEVRGYQRFARQNLAKHLTDRELSRLCELMELPTDKVGVQEAGELMDLLGTFHWNSGLSKLSESKPLGPFAYARTRRGLEPEGEGDENHAR